MNKLLVILLLVPLFCFSQDHEQYIPTIAWSTNIDNVVFINTDTFTVDVLPLDLSEPGAFPLRNGNYLADNRGLRYLVIDTTAYPTLTVVDIFKEGFAPFQGKIGYVYQSAGDGKSHSLPTIMFEKLDPKAFDYGYRLDMNILWGQLGQLFDTVSYDTSYVVTENEQPGTTYWDEDNLTYSDVLLNGVIGQRYQELFIPIKNTTGSILEDGTPVMYSGTVGASGKLEVVLAIADGTVPAHYMLGITTEEIGIGEFGLVTVLGKTRGLDASGTRYGEVWAEGDVVFVSPFTEGYLTNIEPNAPYLQISVAVIADNSATIGEYIVRPTWNGKIVDMADVDGTPVITNGQIMVWKNDSSYFDFDFNIYDYLRIEDAPEFATLLEATTGINDSTIISPETNAGVNELINVPYYGAKENLITDYNITADSAFVNRLEIGDDNVVRRISYPLSGLSAFQQTLNLIVDGVDVYMETDAVDGGNIAYVFDEERHILDCTTGDGVGGMAQVQLTVGTATAPQINYIYVVPNGTGVATLMASTSLPTDTFAWHSVVVLQDVTTISTHGAIALQRMTEALKHNGRGQLSYMREKLRWLGAKHVSGATSTITSTNPLDVLVSSGEIFQLHRQVFPTLNVGVDGITVANASGAGTLTKFENIHDLNDIAELADGSSIGNAKYASVTIWATMASSDQTGNQSKLFVNLPIGFYGSESEAIADANNYDVRTVDSEFQTTAFLVSRVVFKRLGGLNVPVGDGVYSLTGLPLGSVGGGAGSTALTEFNDAVFHIYNNADPTKIIDFDVSGVTTGTMRTFNVPDYDINFGGLVIDGSDSLVNGNTVYDYIVPISALITANLDSINLFRPLIDANTGKDTTGIYHSNRTALDLVSGTNTGDQDISGIATNASDISDLQDTVAIHLDTLQAHNLRINQNTSDIAAIPTTEEQTATLLEAQTGINDSVFITPATLMAAIELNSIQSYGEEEHLYMPNRNITGDTLFGYITITESQISDLTHFVNADETDQVYVASEAFNIDAGDITNLGNLSNTNTGDQDISGIATNASDISDLNDSIPELRADINQNTSDIANILPIDTVPADINDANLKTYIANHSTGVTDHSALTNLDFASAGHTDFVSTTTTQLIGGFKTFTSLSTFNNGVWVKNVIHNSEIAEPATPGAGIGAWYIGTDGKFYGKNDGGTVYDLTGAGGTTDLSLGAITSTTIDVNSSTGTNATLLEANTTQAGILGSDKWDEIVANSAFRTTPSTVIAAGTNLSWVGNTLNATAGTGLWTDNGSGNEIYNTDFATRDVVVGSSSTIAGGYGLQVQGDIYTNGEIAMGDGSDGLIRFKEASLPPSSPSQASEGLLYMYNDGSGDKIWFKNNAASEFDLTAGSSLWTDGSGYLSPVTITDEVRIGAVTDGGDYKLQVWGNMFVDEDVSVGADLVLYGAVYDVGGSPGTSGQILSSTVTGTDWIDACNDLVKAFRSTTANTTLTATDYTVYYTQSTGSGITVTFPSASSNAGRVYVIVNSSAYSLTSSTYQPIGAGGAITTIPTSTSITIQSSGSSWFRIN